MPPLPSEQRRLALAAAEAERVAAEACAAEQKAALRSRLPTMKTEPVVTIYLPGTVRGKGAGKATVGKYGKMAGKAMVYQDAETRNYEGMVRDAGAKAMAGRPLFDCTLRCRITAVFAVPPSKSNKFRELALAGIERHSVKPDDDNILKTRDGLKGVVFTDDSRFCESTVRKFYGLNPGLLIEIFVWQGTML